MVEHYQSRPGILEAGGFPLILDLLMSEYAIIQDLALRILHSCLHNSKSLSAMVASARNKLMS